jgi:hypothetical protein
MSQENKTQVYLQGRVFSPTIDEALDKIHARLEREGLTGEPRVWRANVQTDKILIWWEYCCECEEKGD